MFAMPIIVFAFKTDEGLMLLSITQNSYMSRENAIQTSNIKIDIPHTTSIRCCMPSFVAMKPTPSGATAAPTEIIGYD